MRYVLYARKSSESEDRQVQSIDDQLRILHGVAEQRNLDIVSEILESKSAKSPGDRPEFNRMMKMLERGEADAILCWSVNRLSRNPVDSGLLSWMLQNGLILSIQTPERTYLPEDNILVFSVETGMANQYILDLKKAVMRGMTSKLEKGWFPHRAPEGYTNDLRTHTIEIDPERFPLIQRAWRVLLSEEISIDQLRKRMNEEWGYRTRPTVKSGNKPLSRSSAYRIFTDVFYTGYFRHNGQTYTGKHAPMITVEEFDKVQQRVRGEVPKDRYSKHAFPYKGLILCAKCGCPLTAERQKGRHKRGDWVYYHCNNASGFCGKTSIREDVLEKRLNECLEAITITPNFRDVVMDALEKWTTSEFRGLESVYEQQTRSMNENERLQNELLEMRMRQLIDDETFRRKQAQLREEFVLLKGKSGNIEERLELTRKTVENAMEFRLKAREEFLAGDLDRRRAIARTLGVRYLYQEGKVFIEMHPLLMYQAKPMKDIIEPREIGSVNKKDGILLPSVPLGCDSSTSIEPLVQGVNKAELYDLFTALLLGGARFTLPAHVLGHA